MVQTSKIYERILGRRLRIDVEDPLREWKLGSRPRRGTLDLIFTLKIIYKRSWEWKK